MRYRKLTATGDYSFGHGQQDFYRDTPEAVGQAVKTRLLLWLGEWFLDIEDGTPYFQGVLGKKTIDEADQTLKQRILGTQGIVDIESYASSIDQETRLLTVTCTINTIYGQTAVQVANQLNY